MAIAIKSTVQRLIRAVESYPGDVFIAPVTYIDYDTTPIPTNNAMYPLVYKRRSFEHEQELRAIVNVPPPRIGLLGAADFPLGVLVPVDVAVLVETVYIAPQAPEWFVSTVRRTVADSGFPAIDVRQSRLGEIPII